MWIVVSDFVEAGVAVCVVAAFFVLVEFLVVVFTRVFHRLAVGIVGINVGGIFDARGMRSCVTSTSFSLFVCMTILIICRCVVWNEFFTTSVIVHVPDAKRSDHCGVEEFESVCERILW